MPTLPENCKKLLQKLLNWYPWFVRVFATIVFVVYKVNNYIQRKQPLHWILGNGTPGGYMVSNELPVGLPKSVYFFCYHCQRHNDFSKRRVHDPADLAAVKPGNVIPVSVDNST